jgi:prephenate dehydrogenase
LVARFYRLARTKCALFAGLPQGVVAMKSRRILVVGLGLIGGSLALALKQRKTCLEVLGVSRSETTVEKALAKGVIDRGSTSLAAMLPVLQAGDIVVIATPTLSVKNICEHLKDAVQQGVLITDVASVKGSVVHDAEAVFGCLPKKFYSCASHSGF